MGVIPLPALREHEIHLFRQVRGPVGNAQDSCEWRRLAIVLGELASSADQRAAVPSWVPVCCRPALAGRYASEPVWRPTEIEVGADLHAHVRRLVRGVDPQLSAAFRAGAQTIRLLTEADLFPEDVLREARQSSQLVWIPSEAAYRRLAEGGVPEARVLYGISISDLTCHLFRTGIGFVRATITVRPRLPHARELLAVELLEVAVSLARQESFGWLEAEADAPPPMAARFTMGSLLSGLVEGRSVRTTSIDRSFTYTFASFDVPVASAAADRYALLLARHYTADYELRENAGSIGRVRDFDTVGHVISLEGAATVVAPDVNTNELPSFLREFLPGTFRQHYIPIALLAHHEHAFLIQKTTDSNFWLDPASAGTDEKNTESLRTLVAASLSFRLGFRFSQVSLISMHNAINRAFRESLGLDRMLAELTADVTEAATFLSTVQREKAERQRADDAARRARADARWRPVVTLGPAFVVGIGVFQVADEFADDWLGPHRGAAWWSLGVMVVAVMLTYWIQRWLQSRYDNDDPGTVDQTNVSPYARTPSHRES